MLLSKSYAVITELTPEIYKGYNKYKFDLRLCKPLPHKILFAKSGLNDNYFTKTGMYDQLLFLYLNESIDFEGEFIESPKLIKNYKPGPELTAFIKTIGVKNAKPTLYRFYLISERDIDIENTKHSVTDLLRKDFGTDHLASFVDISKINYFPFEHKHVKTTKIPLDGVIDKMAKEAGL